MSLFSFIEEMNFAGSQIIDAANQTYLVMVEHFAQDRAVVSNLLHDQTHIRFRNLVHKFQVL